MAPGAESAPGPPPPRAPGRGEGLAARKPLEDRLAKARRAVDATNGTAALEPFRGGDVRAAWERLDVDGPRAVLAALIGRCTAGTAGPPVSMACGACEPVVVVSSVSSERLR